MRVLRVWVVGLPQRRGSKAWRGEEVADISGPGLGARCLSVGLVSWGFGVLFPLPVSEGRVILWIVLSRGLEVLALRVHRHHHLRHLLRRSLREGTCRASGPRAARWGARGEAERGEEE